jgi:hypothetical protein
VSNTSVEHLADGHPVGIYVMSYRVDRVKFKFSLTGRTSAYERQRGTAARTRSRRPRTLGPADL